MRERMSAALEHTPFKVEFESLFAGIDALETPADAELVRLA
jgi:hypothetical protein